MGRDFNDLHKDTPADELRKLMDAKLCKIKGNGDVRKDIVHVANDEEIVRGPKLISAADFIRGYVAPDFVIDGIVQRGFVYSMTGRTGDGKTALAIYLSIKEGAAGQRIVYLAGENPDDIRARVIMTCEKYTLEPEELSVHFIAGTFDIGKAIETISAQVEAIGGADIVFVDTSAAYFQGSDENSNTEAIRWAKELRALTSLPGNPAVIVLAHPIKAAKQKSDLIPRGGGAFIAEVDGNLTVFSEDKGETFELHWVGKLRGPGFEPKYFRTEERNSSKVVDKHGVLIPSVVAVPMNEEQIEKAQKTEFSEEDSVLECINAFPSYSLAKLAEHLKWFSKDGKPYKSKVQRLADKLVTDRYLAHERGRYVMTQKGERAATRLTVRR